MPKVICTRENASNNINGVNFTETEDHTGVISDEIDQETADLFLEIDGYHLAPEEAAAPAPAPAPKAPAPAPKAPKPEKAAKPAAAAPAPAPTPAPAPVEEKSEEPTKGGEEKATEEKAPENKSAAQDGGDDTVF